MVAYTFLAVLLAVSAAIGYFVYRSQSERRLRRSIAIAVSAAILIAGLAGIVFLYAALSYPANDDPRFTGRNTIEIAREDRLADRGQPQKSVIRLVFPYEVRKDSDFEVRLVLSAAPAPISAGSYVSTLTAPKTLELRPEREGCTPAPTDAGAACNEMTQPKPEITLSWDITPTAEAETQLRLEIPVSWPSGGSWRAAIKFDGHSPVYGTGPGCNDRWAGLIDSSCREVFPVMLDASRPDFVLTEDTPGTLVGLGWALPYAYARPEIDLEHNQVRFPIRVLTSLGLNASTYAKLALLGTVLSSFLGSGWAWKILELLKGKEDDKEARPTSHSPSVAPPQPPSRNRGSNARTNDNIRGRGR